jgi:hypothetical protein
MSLKTTAIVVWARTGSGLDGVPPATAATVSGNPPRVERRFGRWFPAIAVSICSTCYKAVAAEVAELAAELP